MRRSINDAFELFTDGIGRWFPVDRYTFGPGRSRDVFIEPWVGGRFYERFADGDEHIAGRVLVWSPPERFAFTWQHDEWIAPTDVHVRFVAEDGDVTRVELEHRGWERLGEVGLESRESYANGWPSVLRCYTEVAGAA